MGSLPAEELPQGCLYLNRSIYNQFEEVKTQRHYDTNHLLEQLIGFYCKQAGETKGLDVRLDLAIKFLSLQALTPFENSNDLMTHLLAIHSSHEKSQEPAKPSGETTQTTEQQRPKKNKRKPDYVQKKPYTISSAPCTTKNSILKSVIENLPANRSRSPSMSFSEDSGCFDISKEEPKPMTNGLCPETNGPYMQMAGLDLSVVKKEEDGGAGAKTLKTDKDHLSSLPQSTPLTQLKPSESRNQQRNLPPTWRSNSVPAGDYTPVVSPQQSLSLQTSPQNYILNNIAQNSDPGLRRDGIFDREVSPIGVDAYDVDNNQLEEDESESENYNYVLTGLDSPESPLQVEEDDAPMSMKMPIRMPFPASKKQVNSSDLSLTVPLKIVEDEEPQDLTSPQKNNQSKIISLGQSNGMPPLQAPGANQPVFPNMPPLRPGLMPTLFKHPKGTLIGEPQVSGMQNVARHPRIITLPVNQGNCRPFSFLLPNNAQQNRIAVSPMLSPPGPPPKLIPASSVANIPFQASMGVSAPNGSAGNLSALVAVDPNSSKILKNKRTMDVPNGAVMIQYDLSQEKDQGDDELQKIRRKRKKMDDTTSFRDPPESSLPFNGPNKYRFYCDVCDTGFTRRYTYNRHRCKGKVEKHYCQLCDKAYLSKYKLKDHILVKHEGQTVACPDCGKRFSSRSSMEMHKKQQHEGQFSIWCKICGKGFNHTGHYYGHMNKHTNTKPFWCQKCGKRFYGSSYLHNHKQVCRGDDDWNHQCSICQRKFKCELYLKKHMKIHDSTPIYQQALDSSPNEVSGAVHDPTPIYQQALDSSPNEVSEAVHNPTSIYQQALDSNQNEVSGAMDGEKSVPNPEDKSAEPVADVADDVPTDLTDTSKVGCLNNNEFQQVDQAVA